MTRHVDRWMFESFALSPRSLGVARIIIAAYLVLFRSPQLGWTGSLPDPFFRPPAGPLGILNEIPASRAFTALSLGLSIATVSLLVGYHTRVASCLSGLLLLAVDGFTYSFGHVHHSGTYLAVVLVVMAASNWGAAYSVDALRRRSGSAPATEAWPIALAALLLGFLMLTSALPKLGSGWLDPSALAVRDHVVHYHFVAPRDGLLGDLPLELTSPFIWKPLDYLTILFELGFVIAIVSPRWIRLFCAAAVVFHFGIFVAFGISFTGNVVAYSIFFEWSRLVDRLRFSGERTPVAKELSDLRSRITPVVGPAVVLAGLGLYLITDRVGAPMRWLVSPIATNPDRIASFLVFGVALTLALPYLVVAVTRLTTTIVRQRDGLNSSRRHNRSLRDPTVYPARR